MFKMVDGQNIFMFNNYQRHQEAKDVRKMLEFFKQMTNYRCWKKTETFQFHVKKSSLSNSWLRHIKSYCQPQKVT